ncbi:PrsW family intramembrane metalloprotease [Candidatus Chloroploca sp. M-50]|uniref:PrsW family intramembrane metalloprotease n=1 Tax=Candidatus Chloroploca mongolica TaxID=2528176 RepID=A0ABS4DA83_9CHLR|nr:PrsW family intramembrane metalloprotease [Candidatus Chloroploca mongolica]MBP1466352.1 PrsW family intramembrane metalloprotease [Candidatus Chloroploca mongolica]
MAFLIAVLLSFIPAFFYASIVYWLDRFEKEPKRLLVGAFLWGALVATIGAIIWTSALEVGVAMLIADELMLEFTGTALLAPIVEEVLKGIAVGLIFLIAPYEFDSVLDGMVYGAITALGFAATENVLYLYFLGYQDGGYESMFALFILRVILGGWGHAVYTAFFGMGLALARLRRGTFSRIFFPLLGLFIAIFLHALHNGMAVLLGEALGLAGLALILMVDWIGWLVALGVVIWALMRERRWLKTYLREEAARGTISVAQYETASSLRKQMFARWRSREARLFYQTCAELAQKKHQLARMGEERGNSAMILQLRNRLADLSPQVG